MLTYPFFESFSKRDFTNDALVAGAAVAPAMFSHLYLSSRLLNQNWDISKDDKTFMLKGNPYPCVKIGEVNHRKHEFVFEDSEAVQDVLLDAQMVLPQMQRKAIPCQREDLHVYGIIGTVIGLQTKKYFPLLVPTGYKEEAVYLIDFGDEMPIKWKSADDVREILSDLEALPAWFDLRAAALSLLDYLDLDFEEIKQSPEERGVIITSFNREKHEFEDEYVSIPARPTFETARFLA